MHVSISFSCVYPRLYINDLHFNSYVNLYSYYINRSVHILIYILRSNTFFYCAMTIYIPFILFKSNGAWFFFSIWVFLHEHWQITGLQGMGEGISLTPHHHFHPFHRHLDISRAITEESSPLQKASSRTRTGNFVFPAQVTNH